MIARIWYGRTRPEHFDEYAKYVEETGLRGLGATAGNLGSFLFRRRVDDQAEFLVLHGVVVTDKTDRQRFVFTEKMIVGI